MIDNLLNSLNFGENTLRRLHYGIRDLKLSHKKFTKMGTGYHSFYKMELWRESIDFFYQNIISTMGITIYVRL